MKLVLATLAGICVYATLLACAIALEALGTWLYSWHAGGYLYGITLVVGLVPAGITSYYIYTKALK